MRARQAGGHDGGMIDPYLTGACRWTELGYLAGRGWHCLGVDLSAPALAGAAVGHEQVSFARADVTMLPLRAGAADLLLDRGCFHYLPASARTRYASEAARVLRPGGRLLLRMCLTSAGVPNGLDEDTIRAAFGGWEPMTTTRIDLVGGERIMPAVLAIMVRPVGWNI